ncbi:MAG: hypothetical protein GIW99_09630 [Candidatus Eremiobacteraeota bacterium]|nr:hypothetical protein [Candidatus Eremiobacteraeota bacterium]MBC5827921.1 hypothetical protein [Candidatus Eremiobacteraeota bacterium]
MSLEVLNTIGNLGTFIVLSAAAIAAINQLRHTRAANHLDAVLALERDFNSPNLQESLAFVQSTLPTRMQDRSFRAELAAVGFIDPRSHPEMNVLNWFNQIGTLVKNEFIDEDAFLDQFSRLIDQYWMLLGPTVALLRRARGNAQYQNFEYIASRSRQWRDRGAAKPFPQKTPRMRVDDPWLAEDTRNNAPPS